MADEGLVQELLHRLSNELPQLVENHYSSTPEKSEIAEASQVIPKYLVQLCSNQLGIIAAGLTDILDTLLKATPNSEDQLIKHVKSELYILDLIAKGMAFQWNHIKTRLHSVEVTDEKERIRLKETEEQILPPPLDDHLAQIILDRACFFLLRTHPIYQSELWESSGELIFQLSASNFEIVLSRITPQLSNPQVSSEDDPSSPLTLIEYINLNSSRLNALLDKVAKTLPNFRKTGQQLTLAKVLRKAIWNWIDHYPMEFVSLCQSGVRPSALGNPQELFDVFDGWASNNKMKISLWPAQSMLLILCPDVLLEAHKKERSNKASSSKEKFLENLKKSLKNSKLANAAAICCVDICKASTFVSKNDHSALRFLVTDMEAELKERLFNPSSAKDGIIDQKTMSDLLVASFRLNHQKVVHGLFHEFCSNEFPSQFKLILLRSLKKIVKEGQTLPWSPTISDVYPSLAPSIRSLFQNYEEQLRLSGASKVESQPTKGKSVKQLEKFQLDSEVLLHLISLFYDDPILALHPGKNSVNHTDEVRTLWTGLCYCVAQFLQPGLSIQAAKTMLELHKPQYISYWSTKNVVTAFWEISSSIVISLANVLIEHKDIKPPEINRIISLLEEILHLRNEFILKNKDSKPDATTAEIRTNAATALETVFFIYLCSSEPEICSKCALCFGVLCDECDLLGELDAPYAVVANYSVYRQLSTTGLLSTGRVAQQKAIRSVLRRVEHSSSGNFSAWKEVYDRWSTYLSTIMKGEDFVEGAANIKRKVSSTAVNKTLQDKGFLELLQEWKNYTGFLCALGGVCLTQTRSNSPRNKTRLGDGTIEQFISELLELVVCENVNVRESIKEVMINLSPTVYPILFRHLHREVQSFFGAAGQIHVNSQSTLFVDQTITITKQVLECKPESAGDLSLLTEFEDLVLDLLKYVSPLESDKSCLVMKIKLCGLLDAMMEKIQYISFRNEIKFRNTLVEMVMEWMSQFSEQSFQPEGALEVDDHIMKELQKLLRELDFHCIKTISALVRGLPLQSKETDSKSNRFIKYFTFFSNLLTRCKRENNPQLAEYTVHTLSNLLSANIDFGFQYFVSMGYNEDLETRAAFLQVLTNTVRAGAEFESLVDDSSYKYEKLAQLLLDPDLEVVVALCESTQITEADEVAQLLVRFFEANDQIMLLLKKFIVMEVEKTETSNTLFRRNSMATKLLAAYSKTVGDKYLRQTLLPVIKELISSKWTFEIDPQRLGPSEDLDKNLTHLKEASQRFLDSIYESLPNVPIQLREICNFLKKVVSDRFPDSERIVIGGFMFLRFLCPAIVAPDGWNLVDVSSELTKELRRGLVLTTKTLQNLANRIQFTKEPHMAGMNPFIESNLEKIGNLFDKLAEVPSEDTEPPESFYHISDEQKDQDLNRLHYHLQMSLGKVQAILSTNDKKIQGQSISERLQQLLSQLGSPLETSTSSTHVSGQMSHKLASGTNMLYEKFMRDHKDSPGLETIKERNIYYQTGANKDKHPVYYYIARRFENDLDVDDLIYHILKTTQPNFNKPWSLVLDCTLFGPEHHLPIPCCTKFLKLFPEEGAHNLEKVIILHPNHWFKKYCKRLGKLLPRAGKKYIFLTSVSKLTDYISEPEISLPPATMSLESEVKSSFFPVTKISNQYNQKEVTIRISNALLQVITSQQHNIMGKQTPLVDLYHISRIEEIVVLEDHDFVVSIDWNGTRQLTFRTTNSPQIVQQLKAAKAHWNLSTQSHGGNKVQTQRRFRPSDVPGTLLNMSLLNLCSPRYSCRVAAYSLLDALCRSFNFSTRLHILDASALCIPRYCPNFIQDISTKLAATEKNLTLEFLLESLHGLSYEKLTHQPTSKLHFLDYIAPWLPNLISFIEPSGRPDYVEKLVKVKEVLFGLVEFTIRESSIRPVILDKVWMSIASPNDLEYYFDLICEKAVEYPLGSSELDAICDIFVALASQSPQVVAGGLIAKVRKEVSFSLQSESVLSDPILGSSTGSTSSNTPNNNLTSSIQINSPAGGTGSSPTSSTGSAGSSSLMMSSNQNVGSLSPSNIIIGSSSAASGGVSGTGGGTGVTSNSNISSNSLSPGMDSLDNSPKWTALTSYSRLLLTLSFNNLCCVESFLPELFHLVILLFHTGSSLVRATVHGLLINIVHSLYTTVTSEDVRQSLRFYLAEFSQPKWRVHFGIGGLSVHPYNKPTSSKKLEKMPIQTVETLANALLLVLNAYSPSNPAIHSAWHARWLSLATEAAFTPNHIIQPRAFVSLGVLCRSPLLVTDDLMTQILITLKDTLSRNSSSALSSHDSDLPTSMLICLTHIFEFLPPTSKYFESIFWIGMTLLQIGEEKLYTPTISLLEVVLKKLDEQNVFKENGMAKSLLLGQERRKLSSVLDKVDEYTGISFRSNFSFAVAAHVLKGLKRPETKTVTTRFLSTCIDIGAKQNVGPHLLGFLACLLPVLGKENSHLRVLLSTADESQPEPHQYLISDTLVKTEEDAVLLYTFLIVTLQVTDFDHEKIFIYETLKEGIELSPEVFPLSYDLLLPKMSQVISSGSNKSMIDAVLSITRTMFSTKSKKKEPKDKSYLYRIGFSGLLTLTKKEERSKISHSVCQLITILVNS